MMRHLHIRNYALIDQLDIDWNVGYTVMTGETGSGKSILLGALGLILGKRADSSVLHSKKKKCVVEAIFDLSRFQVQDFFTVNDLDYEEQTTIRREINQNGKSRAFINDTPVKLNTLKMLGSKLVDIHSQHETLNLKNNLFQLQILDNFANLSSEKEVYRSNFVRWKNLLRQITKLREEIRLENQSQDFNTFQLEEIEALKLNIDEQIVAETELELLNSAEDIQVALHRSSEALIDGDSNALALLRKALQSLENIRDKSSDFEQIFHRLQSANIELKDLGQGISVLITQTEHNPNKAKKLQERLDEIYRLQQKHGVSDVESLLDLAESLRRKLSNSENRVHELEQLESSANELHTTILRQADDLSKRRREASIQLEEKLNEILALLEMKSAAFKVGVELLSAPDENGTNRIDFELKANKGRDFLPLHQVASGGELSRVMLALKSLHSGKISAPTLILDEIDTGVSGKVATAMAELLYRMGSTHQLICITHLPQIAARGQHHVKVYKTETDESTSTLLKVLDRDDRLNEIAGMLSGFNTTEAAVENARNLMHLN